MSLANILHKNHKSTCRQVVKYFSDDKAPLIPYEWQNTSAKAARMVRATVILRQLRKTGLPHLCCVYVSYE